MISCCRTARRNAAYGGLPTRRGQPAITMDPPSRSQVPRGDLHRATYYYSGTF